MQDVFSLQLMRRSLLRGLLFGVLVLALLAIGLLSTRLVHAASSGQNCDDNAVVFCGATSASGLIGKYNDGDGRNTATSIHNIYSWFGISSSDVAAMGSTAQNGSVTSSGNVYVGSTLVATNALTGGRQNIQPGSTRQDNQGTIFYTRPPSVSFLSSPLSAFVVMKNGVFQFAVLMSCGNPVKATPKMLPPPPTPTPAPMPPPPVPAPTPTTAAPTPTPTPTPVATPSVSICSGNTTNSNSNTTNNSTNTNSSAAASQGGNCSTNTTTVVQQQQAAPQCTDLIVEVSQTNPMMVTAVVSFEALDGAQLQNIIFNFGDNTTATAPTAQTMISHTFAQSGTFTVTATLNFMDPQTMTVVPSACQAVVTITAPPAPAVVTPSSSTMTTTSAPTPTPTPVATPAVSTSTQLANTGPGDVAAIFVISSLLGTIGYRIFLGRSLGRL